jgi:hypothetical protein
LSSRKVRVSVPSARAVCSISRGGASSASAATRSRSVPSLMPCSAQMSAIVRLVCS